MAATKRAKPACVTLLPWLWDNLGRAALAPLTGTDMRALRAAVQIIELYAYDRSTHALYAFGQVVLRMQPGQRYMAFHAIAHVMDWSDRADLWRQVAQITPTFDATTPPMILQPECRFAPAVRSTQG